LASSTFSRFFIVSRSWRSHTPRTPTGETLRPRFLKLVGAAHLPEGRLRDGERHDRLLDLGRHPVLQNRRLAADLGQRQLAAFVVEFLEGIAAVAATEPIRCRPGCHCRAAWRAPEAQPWRG